MSEKPTEQVNRRTFLKAAAVTAVAATATGAGAALIKSRQSAVPASLAVPAALLPDPALTATNGQATDLLARLAATQAENVRLQAELAAAQRHLDAQTAAETKPDIQAMSLQLNDANQQVGLLAGLVALYEQLDDIDMGDWLEEGVTAVTSAMSELTDNLPDLNDGIAVGQRVLAELDEHIPLLEDGRSWLNQQSNKLQTYFDAIETVLATAVESVGPILQMFSEWVQNILKWLPFSLGQHTSSIMDALTNLLLETPHTVSGLDANIAQPLSLWVSGDGSEAPLRKNVIKPLQERVLVTASQITDKAAQAHTTYQENVARPVATAVANRRQVRTLITTYRQQHQL